MFQSEVYGKESQRGGKHAVAHGTRGGGTNEYAVEEEGGKTADGDDERPKQIIIGTTRDSGVIAKDAEKPVTADGIETREE